MYLNNNNNNNNNNNKSKGGRDEQTERALGGERDIFLIFSLFVSFSYLRKSDRRFLSKQ